jgi:hypothetical protein
VICVEACRKRVKCLTCKRIKAPIGRDVAPAMAGDMCDQECGGYYEEPTAGHLWPDEPIGTQPASPVAGEGSK